MRLLTVPEGISVNHKEKAAMKSRFPSVTVHKLVFTTLVLALLTTAARAGKNANGALIVHTNDAYSYS